MATNRILFRQGVPVVVSEGRKGKERFLVDVAPEDLFQLRSALTQRRVPPQIRRYLGRSSRGAA